MHIWSYPPATKPICAGKSSWRTNLCANTCGACIGTRANTGTSCLGRYFPDSLPNSRWNSFGANTCRACIRTHADTGKNSWRITYVLVSYQGVFGQNVTGEELLSGPRRTLHLKVQIFKNPKCFLEYRQLLPLLANP